MKWWIIILVIFLGALFLWDEWIRFRYRRVDLSKMRLKTGDLLLFSFKKQNVLNNVIKVFGSDFTHVGMVVEIAGCLYVFEATSKEKNRKKGQIWIY